jgi:hypothetical protein
MRNKTERFEFTLTKDLKKRLKEQAKKEKVSIANILEKSLLSYLITYDK